MKQVMDIVAVPFDVIGKIAGVVGSVVGVVVDTTVTVSGVVADKIRGL